MNGPDLLASAPDLVRQLYGIWDPERFNRNGYGPNAVRITEYKTTLLVIANATSTLCDGGAVAIVAVGKGKVVAFVEILWSMSTNLG